MRKFLFLTILVLSAVSEMQGQPVNDECEGAILLEEVRSWCSDVGAYSNVDATPSPFSQPVCEERVHSDVWFTFTPVATDVTITVIGARDVGGGGTLEQPEVALYFGNCTASISEQECESDRLGNNIVELNKQGLAVGQQYLIRVQGRAGRTGTFQLCINNFNPPTEPGSDCFSASILCNKDPFTVQKVSGAGLDPEEANDAECLNIFPGNVESASTWFSWTAANSGMLTFTLTPLNPTDDLDFVLYELPRDPLDCDGKIVLRCMASGAFEEEFPSPCLGPTGLRDGSIDRSEPAGCNDPSQDNFLEPLNMIEGRSYALMVNNFSATNSGFEVEFGGTGEFLGPTPGIQPSQETLCIGEEVSFTDISTFSLGSIEAWEWNFGADASISGADTRGPHTVSYDRPGTKSVVLTITS
ncbi:MAG: hypothetical protein R3350_04910, partial [Saprospiraceae bacterium]|nr:hypothetical protein [Saprospiraceae bacterium]